MFRPIDLRVCYSSCDPQNWILKFWGFFSVVFYVCLDSSKMLLGACWILQTSAFMEDPTRLLQHFWESEQHKLFFLTWYAFAFTFKINICICALCRLRLNAVLLCYLLGWFADWKEHHFMPLLLTVSSPWTGGLILSPHSLVIWKNYLWFCFGGKTPSVLI